ncbi:JAB1/Mov34/MPN/PAD-1 ubiquitin protease-domain-containing protein [Pisolithus albus]|nr:JAB1/Mov34/MPN/PAD-1 ubiquitin protease-domain-containing protein [Pisolithus albus]
MYETCSLVSFLTVFPQMLKHGRTGVPMEVMGLMLGEFVDEYTVQVVDVFAMPQSSTTVTVESIDHVFQMKMVDMLKQTGRPEMVVGWYHSHPGPWGLGVGYQVLISIRSNHSNKCKVAASPLSSIQFSL